MSNFPAPRGEAPLVKKRVFESEKAPTCGRVAAACSLRLVTADNHAQHRTAILLVYHDREVRQALMALLLRKNYDVTFCGDGRSAIEKMTLAHFDLIVTGIVMPDMDGLELIRTLRANASSLPIVAVADESDPLNKVYLRNATLFGASSAHIYPVVSAALLADVDWLTKGRMDVLEEIVW